MNYTESFYKGEVAILMATYNADQFIEQQLRSFSNQTYPFWKLYISDDSLTDDSVKLIHDCMGNTPETSCVIKKGPMRGFAANFLSLVCDNSIKADYYAYSDQDDVWEEEKLAHAINQLSAVDSNVPALYCSRTLLIDINNNAIGFSPEFQRAPGFCNAMVQSIAGGNTMVFNKAAKKILEKAGEVDVVSHDWWTYIAITACGGIVIYDREPRVKYRQHSNNLVGTNNGIKQKLKRIASLSRGDYASWTQLNLQALNSLKEDIPERNKNLINKILEIKCGSLITRLICAFKFPFYRQTFFGNIALVVAMIFKKI